MAGEPTAAAALGLNPGGERSELAVIESPETIGIRPFNEFDEANRVWPRGDRPAAIREAASAFRARFKEQGQVRAVQSVDLVTAPYPTKFALSLIHI